MLARAWTQFNISRGWLIRAARWAPAVIWMAAIFYLSHQSAPVQRVASDVNPFISHVAVYAGLALMLYIALAERPAPRWVPASIAFALAVLYGVTDEIHQAFVPGRVASEADVAADALGAGIVAATAFFFGWLQTAREHRHSRQSPKSLP